MFLEEERALPFVFLFFFALAFTAWPNTESAAAASFASRYRAGLREYKRGDYEAATEVWESLLKRQKRAPRKHRARVCLGVARACLNLGEEERALAYAKRADQLLPGKDSIRALISKITDSLRKADEPRDDLVELEIELDPSSAKVFLNGKTLEGSSRKRTRVKAGTHRLSARLDGYEDLEKSVECSLGEKATAFLKLVPKPETIESAYEAGKAFAARKAFDKAARALARAAEYGHPEACFDLGKLYLSGTGVERNPDLAAKWTKKAAEEGHLEAQYSLSRFYTDGVGLPLDEGKAIEWCKKAAEGGLAKAMCALGLRYEKGRGVDEDLKKAADLYERAAKAGSAEGRNNLATCFRKGMGRAEDLKKAFTLYEKAAEQGNVIAQTNLALCYQAAMGTEKNLEKALSWIKRAAKRDHPHAQYVYGVFLENGTGVDKDSEKALLWYEKASKAGHSGAAQAFEMLSKNY